MSEHNYTSPPKSPPSCTVSTSASPSMPSGSPIAPTLATILESVSNQGVPDMSRGKPGDNIVDPSAWVPITTLVEILLSPPPSSYVHGHVEIRLGWVKSRVYEIHFIHDPAKGRSVLRNDSKIRTNGLAAGLPRRYWEWLCGVKVSNQPILANKDVLWIAGEDFSLITLE